ncbi:RHS repeat-associated core domain-containing protein [Aeromonas salmonicida]|uniref:RHS repeat-associated core domain-containing protein n=1 Tax=Aeromonas salmonicida TaxID=645 RepID=UPI0035C0F52D
MLETLSQHPSSGRQREAQFSYTRQGLPLTEGEHTQWQQGRVSQRGDTHYDYDKAGRLISKRQLRPGFRPEQWHYRWDSRNQLRVVTTPEGTNWFYRYDPFGRRISKRCEQSGEEVRYLWDGDQIAEVRHFKQGQFQARRHWVWRGWVLLVQQRQITQAGAVSLPHTSTVYIEQGLQAAAESWQTDFAVSQQNGELLGLYNPQGELYWLPAKASLWGQRLNNHADNRDPGLAFAGQLCDDEGGLCYNRFRYYDPQGACDISPDPIGILGGENNYGYVPNPLGGIDPFGLSKCSVLDDIIKDANKVASPGCAITSKQANILRNNLPVIQRRTVFQNKMARKEFVKSQSYLMRPWESSMGVSWPTGATPHHIIPLESGGANEWWNLMPTNGALPNHSLPGVPDPHAAGGTLRTTIQ